MKEFLFISITLIISIIFICPSIFKISVIECTISKSYNIIDISYWVSGADMPTPRTELTGTVLDEKIYVIGGYVKKGKKDIVEVYDPDKNKWSTVASLPEPLDHPAAASYKDKLYVIGGAIRSNVPSEKLFIYEPVIDEWKEGEPMPTARRALTANFIDGILYTIGGEGHFHKTLNVNEAYDPVSNTWTEKEPMPTARHHLTSAVVDGKLYVIGGRQTNETSSYSNFDTVEMYDPITNTWTEKEPMPTKRSGLAAVSIEDEIYVIGGEERNGKIGKTFNNNEKYNTVSNTWKAEPPMPTARHGLAVSIIDHRIYAIGGGPQPGGLKESFSGENEIYILKK